MWGNILDWKAQPPSGHGGWEEKVLSREQQGVVSRKTLHGRGSCEKAPPAPSTCGFQLTRETGTLAVGAEEESERRNRTYTHSFYGLGLGKQE